MKNIWKVRRKGSDRPKEDRSIEPTSDKVVIAPKDGKMPIKRLYKDNRRIVLMPENDDFQPINIIDKEEVLTWGVVTSVIHSL